MGYSLTMRMMPRIKLGDNADGFLGFYTSQWPKCPYASYKDVELEVVHHPQRHPEQGPTCRTADFTGYKEP